MAKLKINVKKITSDRLQQAELDHLLIQIPGGQIDLRDDRTNEKWSVQIDSFLIGKFPVTQELYVAVMDENPSAIVGKQHPVESVTWKDAVEFCNRLSLLHGLLPHYQIHSDEDTITSDSTTDGFRLPTEAEWEFACKASTLGIRYGALNDIAWYKENSNSTTHPVGMKAPNSWELYDMLGNVWEWCSDIYDESVYGSYRIFRGGGWADEARSVMATTRRRSHPLKFKIDDLGFRIAKNLPKQQ